MADVRPIGRQSAFPGAMPGLAAYDMGSGRLWGMNQSTPFPLASVAKLIIAVAALAAALRGSVTTWGFCSCRTGG